MSLPPNGSITTDQIMQELGIAVQPREWSTMWGLAKAGSLPASKMPSGPFVLPTDWYGYSHTLPIPTTPPAPSVAKSGRDITVSNFISSSPSGIKSWDIWRNGVFYKNVLTTSYVDIFLIAGDYYYQIVAVDNNDVKSGISPVSATINITTASTDIPLAYFGQNTIIGITSSSLATARTSPIFTSTAFATSYQKDGSGQHQIQRSFLGFNCTNVHNPTTAQVYIQVSTVQGNISLALVATTTVYPANHVWTTADFATANGGTLMSEIKPISATGNYFFQLNGLGLSYINANPNVTFALVENNYDRLNNAGASTNYTVAITSNVSSNLTHNG